MAVEKIKVTFLHVDQGMGTLVGVYDAKELTNLLLFDLGCHSSSKKFGLKGPETVMKELGTMKTPAIDLVLISHQDKDHLNLLPYLTELIKAKLPKTKVSQLRYGGEDKTDELWGKNARTTINDFAWEFGITPKALPLNDGSYNKPPKKGAIFEIDEKVFVRLLCTGVEVSGKPNLRKNCASAVVAIEFAGVNVVLPGDAIAATLQSINTQVFAMWALYKRLIDPKLKGPVEPCIALGVPHHGSILTFGSQYVTIGEETEEQMVVGKRFAANVNAKNIVASAGIVPKFKHPYKRVMDIVGKYTEERPEHDLVWYDPERAHKPVSPDADAPAEEPASKKHKQDPEQQKEGFVVVKRSTGIYTTIITTKDPPRPHEQTFTIDKDGRITFAADIQQAGAIVSREHYPAKPRSA